MPQFEDDFALILPLGAVGALVIGPLCDCCGVAAAMILASTASVVAAVCRVLLPQELQLITFVIFALFRSMVLATTISYVTAVFGYSAHHAPHTAPTHLLLLTCSLTTCSKHRFGTILGTMWLLMALVGVQHHFVLDDVEAYGNLVILAVAATSLAAPAFLMWWAAAVNRSYNRASRAFAATAHRQQQPSTQVVVTVASARGQRSRGTGAGASTMVRSPQHRRRARTGSSGIHDAAMMGHIGSSRSVLSVTAGAGAGAARGHSSRASAAAQEAGRAAPRRNSWVQQGDAAQQPPAPSQSHSQRRRRRRRRSSSSTNSVFSFGSEFSVLSPSAASVRSAQPADASAAAAPMTLVASSQSPARRHRRRSSSGLPPRGSTANAAPGIGVATTTVIGNPQHRRHSQRRRSSLLERHGSSNSMPPREPAIATSTVIHGSHRRSRRSQRRRSSALSAASHATAASMPGQLVDMESSEAVTSLVMPTPHNQMQAHQFSSSDHDDAVAQIAM